MQPWTYPARIERHDTDTDASTWMVSFVDLQEVLTEGSSQEDAERQAADALSTWVSHCLRTGQPVQAPSSPRSGDVSIALEPALAARAALASIMAEQGLSKVALAGRMGKDEKAVRRMLDPKGASLDMVFSALRAVGARPVLSV